MPDGHDRGACCGACGHALAVERGEVAVPERGAAIVPTLDEHGVPIGITLVLFGGRIEPRAIAVDRAEMVLGRSTSADIVVPMDGLSRRQCRFDFTSDGVFVEDLHSACGTYVDGARIQRAPLHHGQHVQVADLIIALQIASH
ncbi:MAG TPA: FHA domain-containing protein [Nannocystaceae bacterium]|nr:FHA domain-containing protein [Nannocystaceae bacterium]